MLKLLFSYTFTRDCLIFFCDFSFTGKEEGKVSISQRNAQFAINISQFASFKNKTKTTLTLTALRLQYPLPFGRGKKDVCKISDK